MTQDATEDADEAASDAARRKAAALTHVCRDLADDPEVTGVFLFGSYARGDSRPDSDIDLLVVRSGAFQKKIVRRDGVEFEMFLNNEPDIVSFWAAHEDDFTSFWADARVLFDREGATSRLRSEANEIRARGPGQAEIGGSW